MRYGSKTRSYSLIGGQTVGSDGEGLTIEERTIIGTRFVCFWIFSA